MREGHRDRYIGSLFRASEPVPMIHEIIVPRLLITFFCCCHCYLFKKRGKGKQFIWTLQYAIVETLTYKQTIDVKGLHSIPRSLSDNILRIPQNGVLIPVNNERIFVGSTVSLIEKHTQKFQIII